MKKSKKQMTLTTAEIADVYANWPAARVATETTEEPPSAAQQAAVDREEAAKDAA